LENTERNEVEGYMNFDNFSMTFLTLFNAVNIFLNNVKVKTLTNKNYKYVNKNTGCLYMYINLL